MTTILGYVLGGLIIFVSALIVVLVLFQDSKKRGLSGAIGGTSSDSFFGKNQGQTKEKKLARYTTISAVVFAVLTIAAYLLVL
jgi:preprotein translocase subunit SecG